jgi:hypothetical protein
MESVLDKYTRYSLLPKELKEKAIKFFGTYQKASGYSYNIENCAVLTEKGEIPLTRKEAKQ